MFVGRPKYSFVRCFVEGFGAARGDEVLAGFQRWLSEQPQHHAVINYAWVSLVRREVFDHGKEDDLAYPGDDALVIEHVFTRLREFLRVAKAEDGPSPFRACTSSWRTNGLFAGWHLSSLRSSCLTVSA
jgi:hypothetical protein